MPLAPSSRRIFEVVACAAHCKWAGAFRDSWSDVQFYLDGPWLFVAALEPDGAVHRPFGGVWLVPQGETPSTGPTGAPEFEQPPKQIVKDGSWVVRGSWEAPLLERLAVLCGKARVESMPEKARAAEKARLAAALEMETLFREVSHGGPPN